MAKKLLNSLLRSSPVSVPAKVTIHTVNPNQLKEHLYKSLMEMNEKERIFFVRRLFAAIANAGVNINNHLLMLGCNPNRALEATANDIAQLIRYYRINLPRLLDVFWNTVEQFPSLKQSLSDFSDQEKAA